MEKSNEANQPKDDQINICNCKQERVEEPILNFSDSSVSSEESPEEVNEYIDAGTNSNRVAAMANNTSDDDESFSSNGDETTEIESPRISNQVNWSTYWPLCKMIEENDWEGVEGFVGDHPEVLSVEISPKKTIFEHIFSRFYDDEEGLAGLIEKLVTKMDPKTLEKKHFSGLTVLHICAMLGNTGSSKVFVNYNSDLPNVRNSYGYLPVHAAAYHGHKDTVQYLIQVTEHENLNASYGAHLISFLIQSNFYDLALDFLKRYPALGRDSINSRNIVLNTLSRKPLGFESGSQLGRWQQFIYNCIPVKKENICSIDPIQPNKSQGVGGMWQELHRMFWNVLMLLVPCIKVILEQKVRHMQTVEILRMICEGMVWNDPEAFSTVSPLHRAARLGISEIVNEITMAYNQSIYWIDQNGCNLFQIAVLHRQEKVFNLIYRFRFHYDMLGRWDKKGNNMLHSAGILSVPSKPFFGAALQMQRELQWFKAVEDLMPPADQERLNNDNKTPREVFTKAHKNLVKEGEEWMNETTSECTITVALIIIVVLALAFTVLGGNSASELPNFLKDQAFLVFTISNTLALCSSSASYLMFLGIQTSRYTEEEFLVSLPRKLIIGLLALFFSVASMMVAFGATVYIVLSHPWKWVIIPICLLGCVPVILSALAQFPPLLDMISSTYWPTIFGPKKKLKM